MPAWAIWQRRSRQLWVGRLRHPWTTPPAAWSKDAVNWALENHLLLGDTNGNLKLRENLSREQFCVMLKRYHDMLQK